MAAGKRQLRIRAYERLEIVVRKHLDAIRNIKLRALRPDDLRKLYAAKLDAGLAPRTVRIIHATIRQSLGQAIKDGTLPRSVALSAVPPKVPKREMRSLTDEEVERFLAGAREERYEYLWTFAVYTGCRIGELFGLTWDAVTWDTGAGLASVTIRQSLTRTLKGVPLLERPKSDAGLRMVYLPEPALEVLKGQRKAQLVERMKVEPAYASHGFVFATREGRPLQNRNVLRQFHVVAVRAGLPLALRLHDLRHTAGTAMAMLGTDVATIAATLGHADPSFSLRT